MLKQTETVCFSFKDICKNKKMYVFRILRYYIFICYCLFQLISTDSLTSRQTAPLQYYRSLVVLKS